ncbi:MAG: DegV domain-containing protein [Candidatus Izimaplasma bacterium HR2]|nr:MAG: DegV domain-containing protein [Candidatus Izimaplasma bacterium HR2]
MKKIAVIATSTGSLDYLDLKNENLKILRLKILAGDNEYSDFVELTAEKFYGMLNTDKNLVPSSSLPSIGELLEMLEEVEKEGYEEVIITTISSQLSGSYQVGVLGQNQYEGNLKIHVVDSLNAGPAEGYFSIVALRLLEEGKTAKEVVASLEALKMRKKHYLLVDNLRLFVANGRLSGASGFVGSVLKIKPILEVTLEGKIESFEKVRTAKKALVKMIEVVLSDLEKMDDFIMIYETSDNLEAIEFVKNAIEAVYPKHKKLQAPITPVIGCHTGTGAIGIAFYELPK